jgi:hypothetical protein
MGTRSMDQMPSQYFWLNFSNSFSPLHLEGGPVRATPGVLSSPTKDISHPSLVIYFLPTSPIKPKRRLQIGGRLLILTHMDQSFWSVNQKQGGRVISYLWHFAVLCTSHSKMCKYADPKPFFPGKPACFDFSSSNFNLHSHTYWALLKLLLKNCYWFSWQINYV